MFDSFFKRSTAELIAPYLNYLLMQNNIQYITHVDVIILEKTRGNGYFTLIHFKALIRDIPIAAVPIGIKKLATE